MHLPLLSVSLFFFPEWLLFYSAWSLVFSIILTLIWNTLAGVWPWVLSGCWENPNWGRFSFPMLRRLAPYVLSWSFCVRFLFCFMQTAYKMAGTDVCIWSLAELFWLILQSVLFCTAQVWKTTLRCCHWARLSSLPSLSWYLSISSSICIRANTTRIGYCWWDCCSSWFVWLLNLPLYILSPRCPVSLPVSAWSFCYL